MPGLAGAMAIYYNLTGEARCFDPSTQPRWAELLATAGTEPAVDAGRALLAPSAVPVCLEEALILSQQTSLPHGDGSLVALSLDRQARVAMLELNDPKHFNALSSEMADDMQRAVAWLRSQPTSMVKAVVLQGCGAHFCPGGNPHRAGQDQGCQC